jgi:hypothetical protein
LDKRNRGVMNKPKRLNPNIIRVGDWVKIINPEFVDRCGYEEIIIEE